LAAATADRQGAGWPALTASLREVAILDEQKLVLADLVAARLVGCWDVFAGDGIDEPVPQAMAGAPIHLAEGDSFCGRGRGIERDRAGDEG
jgi:hypothetical protein